MYLKETNVAYGSVLIPYSLIDEGKHDANEDDQPRQCEPHVESEGHQRSEHLGGGVFKSPHQQPGGALHVGFGEVHHPLSLCCDTDGSDGHVDLLWTSIHKLPDPRH